MLNIIAPDPNKHGEAICDLAAKTFGHFGGGYFRSVKFMRAGRVLNSHYDWKTSRIGLAGEQLATHWGVFDYQMRVATARLRVAGVGLVVRHPDFTGKGIMAMTAWASLDALKPAGYDVTFLTGIDNYYSRYGYVRSWPGQSYWISVAELSATKPAKDLTRFDPAQRKDIVELYNREHASLTGTAVHPTFPRTKRPGFYEGYLWNDTRGRAAGYILIEPYGEDLVLLESAGEPDAILRGLSALVRSGQYKRVKFMFLHSRSRLAGRLRRGNCQVELAFKKDGQAMMRSVNLRQTFEKISSVLSLRLKNSELNRWSGVLSIHDVREHVALEIAKGRVRVGSARPSRHAVRGGEQIIQLVVGTHPPQETIDAAAIRLSGDAKMLVPVLFPHEEPQLALSDQI